VDRRPRVSLVRHGIILVLLGLLAGIPFALVITGDLAGEVRAWRIAHLEGVLNGLMLLGVGAAGGLIRLPPVRARVLVVGLLVAGYGNLVASVLAAAFGVRGLTPTGPAANVAVLALFTAAAVGVFAALCIALAGTLDSRGDDATS